MKRRDVGNIRPMRRPLFVAVFLVGLIGFTLGPYAQTGAESLPPSTTTPANSATPAYNQPLFDFAPVSTIAVSTTGPTDAVFAAAEAKYNAPLVGSTQWHGFLQQMGRNIQITLPQPQTVSSVSIEMKQVPKIGVYFPDHVTVEVEHNGTWYLAASVNSLTPTWSNSNSSEIFTANLGNVQAQDIILRFPVSGWVFARQIHVWGYQNTPPNPFPAWPTVPKEYNTAMTTSDVRAHGIRNMLLVYTGAGSSQSTWSVHDFLPMTGYMNSKGRITGRMFDTMLFLPSGKLQETQSAWLAYLNNLFTPGSQLAALNQAVATTNWAVSGPGSLNYKEKVVIGIPQPNFGSGVWGTVNGVSLNFNGTWNDTNAVQARIAAVQWYVNTLIQKWKAANLSDLQLTGLYWIDEKVNYRTPADLSVIQASGAFANAVNLPLFWIPYYDAAGIQNWQSHGFTAAWLQPLYLDTGNTNPQRLTNAVQLAQDTGMGIEIEAPWEVVSMPAYRNLYLQMLTTLENDKMAGNVSHAFYAGSKVLVTAAYATNAADRSVYDATYKFMNHS